MVGVAGVTTGQPGAISTHVPRPPLLTVTQDADHEPPIWACRQRRQEAATPARMECYSPMLSKRWQVRKAGPAPADPPRPTRPGRPGLAAAGRRGPPLAPWAVPGAVGRPWRRGPSLAPWAVPGRRECTKRLVITCSKAHSRWPAAWLPLSPGFQGSLGLTEIESAWPGQPAWLRAR
jgi:hypothetical protein